MTAYDVKVVGFFKVSSVILLFAITGIASSETLTLEQLLDLLQQNNPSLFGAEAEKNLAIGAMKTAKQYPNPDMDVGGGLAMGLGQGALSGSAQQFYMSQPLDLPFVREARRLVAEAGINSAEQARDAVWLIIRAKTRQAFYEIMRRQAELAICQDNEHLLEQIRNKVALKVEVGEAAKYEEVKAEAELLNAVKLRMSAVVLVDDAKSALRALFSNGLASDFDIQGELPKVPMQLPSLDRLQETIILQQPLLQKVHAEINKAKARVHLEQQMRYPQLVLKAGVESDPGLQQWRIGVSVPLPIWNQRQGPIAEAQAHLQRIEAEATEIQLSVMRELQHAYNSYLIADKQVLVFETGLLKQAEKALQVAESAYRLGARGILDYLDAQRTYRSVRNDYINARFDRENALIDLERLNAEDFKR